MNLRDIRHENQVMKRFIAMYLPPGGETIILADGGDGPVAARIEVAYYTDDYIELEISTNLPEWVTLERIYNYYRAMDMTESERKGRRACEVADSRYRQLVTECLRLFAPHLPSRIQVVEPKRSRVSADAKEGILRIDEDRFAGVDYYDCLIVKTLVKAKGNVMSRREMQQMEPALRDEGRIDRRVRKLKEKYKQLDAVLEVVPNKGYRIRPGMFE